MDATKASLDEKEHVDEADKAVDEKAHHPPPPTSSDPAPPAWTTLFAARDPAQHRAAEARFLRKVDARLMPTLIFMYLLNFLDRSNLAQARQGTLESDLRMTGTDFNLATSIFFVGYLLMQLPSNVLLTRLRPSLYLAASCGLWGVVSACNAAAGTFPHLVAVRFFLGFAEAPFFPGAVFLMSSWYTRAELTRRVAWLYSGNALANMFGGLVGAGILGGMEGSLGIAGWRWLFIIVSFPPFLVPFSFPFLFFLFYAQFPVT